MDTVVTVMSPWAGYTIYNHDEYTREIELRPLRSVRAQMARVLDQTKWSLDIDVRSGNYIDGKAEGLAEAFYPNGQLKYKFLYRNGDRESIERYFADGSIEEKDITVDGKRTYERYYANGQLRQKWFYINGVREGLSEEYWENGLPESKSMYKNGKFIKIQINDTFTQLL